MKKIIITYIIECSNNEYYCGKTNNLDRRLKEHRKEKYPKWFKNKIRRNFICTFFTYGDYEKKIKRFGIKNFINCLNSSPP